MSIKYDGQEYEEYGNGYVMRAAGSTEDWQPAPDPLPREVADRFAVRRMSKRGEVSRPRPRTEGMFKGGARGGAIVKPNPQLAEDAARLGLTEDEMRTRLNDDSSDGTRTRVAEDELDAMAARYNMSPQEIRDRFAGRRP